MIKQEEWDWVQSQQILKLTLKESLTYVDPRFYPMIMKNRFTKLEWIERRKCAKTIKVRDWTIEKYYLS